MVRRKTLLTTAERSAWNVFIRGDEAQPKQRQTLVTERVPLAKGTKPGRPPRRTGTASPKARLLLLVDRAVAHVVYEAVLAGAALRDDALQLGVEAAERFERVLRLKPRNLKADAVEAIIKRLVKNQDFIYPRLPGQELRFRATMRPNRPFKNGLRRITETPFMPADDGPRNPDTRLLRRIRD